MRGLCLLLTCVLAHAGDGPRPVAELLASEEPREQAWGAYRAASERVDGAVPALRRLLAAHVGEDSEESRLVRETVLDSLIRLEANVPWKELRDLPARDRTRVLILLAKHPAEHVAALRELADDDLPEVEWLLVCNLLCKERAPGFAAFLLVGLELTLEIKVRDPKPGLQLGIGGGIGGGFGSRGRLRVRPGWPPRAHYSLDKNYRGGRGGRVLVAPGPHPIYYKRREVKEGAGGIGTTTSLGDRNRYRIEYLAELLGTPVKSIGLRTHSFVVVAWKDEASYLADAWNAHQRIYRAWDGVVESLLDLELLTAEEAKGLRPELKTIVDDRRESKFPRLPELPG
jgi:hypothetical protein